MSNHREVVWIRIPWPPTINTYWRNVKGKILISAKGRKYRDLIMQTSMVDRWHQFDRQRLSVAMWVYPPDKRRRDLDNLPKAVFDSLEKAGVFVDDEQIDYFSISRCCIKKGGEVTLRIEAL